MLSIDQNCHSLWDVIPKLTALHRRGYRVRHFIEDVDVAFTSLGSGVEGSPLRLMRERFHRSGGQDWGAAIFYSEFLGKMPVEIRNWEAFTGIKTNVLARRLGRSLDDLYDEFSPGDNWQLIGPSYVGDRQHHRLVADLGVGETAEFLWQVMAKARADMLRAFPEGASQQRLIEWFESEEARLRRLLDAAAGGRLVELYRDWLGEYFAGTVNVGFTSDLFSCGSMHVSRELLELFCRDYDLAAGIYNQALEESSSALKPLRATEGELPFFATFEHMGHAVRAGLHLRGKEIHVGPRAFKLSPEGKAPLEEMASAGIQAIAGKAIILAIQVRLGDGGDALALPYRGSLYMPAARALADKLLERGLIRGPLRPIVRVRFRLLERMKHLDTTIRLPAHLVSHFGAQEVSASKFASEYRSIAAGAAARLETFRDPSARKRWQEEALSDIVREIRELDARRRRLADEAPKSEEIRDLWQRTKSLQRDLLDRTLRRIASDYQAGEMDYCDSRGALIPWSIALGGEGFYEDLIARAEIYEEHPAGRKGTITSHYEHRISEGRKNFDVLDWADPESQHKRFQLLADNVPLDGKRLLDVGAGLGDLLTYLKQRNIEVEYTGIDIVEKMVEAAGRRQPDARFHQGDVFAEDMFGPESFDVVFCSGIFNLNLGNNLAFLPGAVGTLLNLTREYLVFNLLHERVAEEGERYFYYDPAAVMEMLSPLPCEVRILDDYLPNDFTVICRK